MECYDREPPYRVEPWCYAAAGTHREDSSLALRGFAERSCDTGPPLTCRFANCDAHRRLFSLELWRVRLPVLASQRGCRGQEGAEFYPRFALCNSLSPRRCRDG